MSELCTCGAQLPPDARFCHKCGKPQREEPHLVEAEAPPPPPPPQPPPPEPARIGFHNRTAVGIALRVAVGAFLLSAVSGIFSILWLIAGGFFCVYLYRRRTGQRLSVLSGAHLGWLAGMFVFVIAAILVTALIALLTDPGFAAQAQEQWKRSFSEADVKRLLEVLRSPGGIASVFAMLFLSFTLLPAFGGAIGAKLLDRR